MESDDDCVDSRGSVKDGDTAGTAWLAAVAYGVRAGSCVSDDTPARLRVRVGGLLVRSSASLLACST